MCRKCKHKLQPSCKCLTGFSFVQLLIAIALSAAISIPAVSFLRDFNEQQSRPQLEAQQREELEIVSTILKKDFESLAYIDGDSNTGGTQPGQNVYGILPEPFDDPGSRISDGFSMYVMSSRLSVEEINTVLQIEEVAGEYTVTVEGDFRPQVSGITDDFVIISTPTRKELFEIKGNVTFSSPQSTFVIDQVIPDEVILQAGVAAFIYRVKKVDYQIGNDSSDRGLYRISLGEEKLLNDSIESMQVFYDLQAKTDFPENSLDCVATPDSVDCLHLADCEAKDGQRWFAHATTDSECTWNDVRSLRVELVHVSDQEFLQDEAPQPSPHNVSATEDDFIRYVHRLRFSLRSYRPGGF